MQGVPYPMWVNYLELLWVKLERQPQHVLEVCCGTGTLCRALAKKGLRMAGVDLSANMITIAKERAVQEDLSIEYSCQDAASFDLPWKFEAAFSFFDSLNYLIDPEMCASAILQTARHLVAGAPFVFDLNTAYAFEQKMFDQSEHRNERKVRYNWVSEYDSLSRICRVEMDFWTDGETFHEIHLQRAHSMEEIRDWMARAGFVDIAFYDAYTLDRPKARSDRIHVVGTLSAS